MNKAHGHQSTCMQRIQTARVKQRVIVTGAQSHGIGLREGPTGSRGLAIDELNCPYEAADSQSKTDLPVSV